jgi:hypothetical protein
MNWLKELHSEDGKLSSKRFYGGLMLVVCIIAVLAKIEHTILEPMLYTGAGLIGFGTTVKIAQAMASKGQPKQQAETPAPLTKEPEPVG